MFKPAVLTALVAFCLSNAIALPAPPAPADPPIKRATIGFNGVTVDCDKTAFLDIYPPTEIELKCRAAQGDIPPSFKGFEGLSKRALVQHDGRTINCDEIAFLAVMPPSELELKCRAAEAKERGREGDLWPINLHDKRDATALTPIRDVVVGKRAVIEYEGQKIDCEHTFFPAIYPPTEPEMLCRQAEEKKKKRSVEKRAVIQWGGRKVDCGKTAFLDVMPPSPLELACRKASRERRSE